MKKKQIGTNAGIIWKLLSKGERWDLESLERESHLDDCELWTAIGWLAREDKIEIEENCFFLRINFYF